ncbi:hypothetical protein EBESD8_18740 [Rhodococcus aetherivorans]|nr:hypothetical protein EBESD8_18740 [Rhodococcus aetherivorans]
MVGAVLGRGRRVGDSAIKFKTIAAAVLVIGMIAAVGGMAWQLNAKSNDLDQVRAAASAEARAEQVALDYATGAADMDFRDLGAWRERLTKGTSPELSNRLTQAATSMEQIISPLQWTSTAQPVAAKVRSESNGIYSVDCFVSVLTKNSQAPDGIQSTATYQLSVDSNNDWGITEIGGIDSALTGSAPSPDNAPPLDTAPPR